MKFLSFAAILTALSASGSALAAEIHCSDEAGKLSVSMTVLAEKTALARSVEVRDARVHVDASYVVEQSSRTTETIDDRGHGGLQWDEYEGGAAVRTERHDYLVSVRTKGFDANGVATGYFEDGAGPRRVAATCRWID